MWRALLACGVGGWLHVCGVHCSHVAWVGGCMYVAYKVQIFYKQRSVQLFEAHLLLSAAKCAVI